MVALFVGLVAQGCSEEGGTGNSDGALDGSGTGGAGGAGAGGAGGAGAGGTGGETGPQNLDCPEYIGPLDGPYAQKGECCYRTSNSERLEAYGDGPAAITEFRLNASDTINHPMSLSLDSTAAVATARLDHHEQSLLTRFTMPRANGEVASGPGTAMIGNGTYNCDGTFSFFGNAAAPARTISDDPARWGVDLVPTTVDATKSGIDRAKASFADTTNRTFAYTPFVNPSTYELEWELVSQGFEIIEIPTGPEYEDCVGARETGVWRPEGKFETYTPMALNDVDIIPSITETLCQLMAFGIYAAMPGVEPPKCTDARCMPGEAGCPWVKLPDSLCPLTVEDQAKWDCHIGDEANEDGEPTNCTAEAPTGVLDPAMGATSEGQCCDPLGVSATLPACNSYRLVNAFVAAAVDITDEPINEGQKDCH